jgi:hypothetical protein
MVCLSCIFTCKFSFLGCHSAHIHSSNTLGFSYTHLLPTFSHIFILSYSYRSIHSPPCNRVIILSFKCWMNASKRNENWKSSQIRGLKPWTVSLRCQCFTCIFYWMDKKGPFADKLAILIEKIYVQFFPIQFPGLFAVRWWSRAAPTPTYRQIWKKMRNKDRETGISLFSRLSGTTPKEAHVFGCRLTGTTPQAIIADSLQSCIAGMQYIYRPCLRWLVGWTTDIDT